MSGCDNVNGIITEEQPIQETNASIGKINRWIIISAIVLVVLLWGLSWYLLTQHIPSWQKRGAFGDEFGAVNALFSGLAFAGVIIAIYIQTKELKLQREELEQTREELKGQKEQLTRQADFINEQNFENKFFSDVAYFCRKC